MHRKYAIAKDKLFILVFIGKHADIADTLILQGWQKLCKKIRRFGWIIGKKEVLNGTYAGE